MLNKYDYDFDPAGDGTAARIVRQVGFSKTVLELGSGPGAITRVLKEYALCRVCGIEVDPETAAKSVQWCEQMVVCSLDDPAWTEHLTGQKFDVIVLADVLEHLRDPVGVLKAATSFLNADGYMVISLPNIAHNGIVAALLQQSFPYRETGLLDKTHIRFFARENLEGLLSEAGLLLGSYQEVLGAPEHTEFAPQWFSLTEAQRALLQQNAAGSVYQFVLTVWPDKPENEHHRLRSTAPQAEKLQVPDQRFLMRLLHEQQLYAEWQLREAGGQLQVCRQHPLLRFWSRLRGRTRPSLGGDCAPVAETWGDVLPEVRIKNILAQYDEPMPVLTVLLNVGTVSADDPALQATVASIQRQTYVNYRILFTSHRLEVLMPALNGSKPWDQRWQSIANLVGDEAASGVRALELVDGEICICLAPGDQLHATAFQEIACLFVRAPHIQQVTFNHLVGDEAYDLPGWSHEFHLARNVVGRALAFRVVALRRVCFDSVLPYLGMLSLWQHFGDAASAHLGRLLLKHGTVPWANPGLEEEMAKLAFAARYPGGRLVQDEQGYRHPCHALPLPEPLVSILIPTRNAANLVRVCLDSLLSKTSYSNYEIILIDNGSDDPEALALFARYAEDFRVRVLRDDSPFNFSALNNRAARHARGDYLLLLNNDTEVISEDWLSLMVGFAVQPENGAIGARLWYPNRTLQHGGVVVCNGGPTHAFVGLTPEQTGPLHRARLAQRYLAVTAACLLVRAQYYWRVGGLDERYAVAFNDVDFCFRLHACGYRNLWLPGAQLVHHESPSRGRDASPEKRARAAAETRLLNERWAGMMANDPFAV